MQVLIIGLGGLGSPASLYLASAGVGTLGLVDADTVELSNLHRQIVHTETAVERGMSKVESAMERLRGLNSEIRILGYQMAFQGGRGLGIVEGTARANVLGNRVGDEGLVEGGYDVVLDCTDNPATRYLISDVCVVTGRVLVSGAAQRAEGQLMRLNYPPEPRGSAGRDGSTKESEEAAGRRMEKGPCYRCVFPYPPAPETVQSCSEIGILGPVVGVIGTLMAMEVLKILTANITSAADNSTANTSAAAAGKEERDAWRPTLLLYNVLSQDPRGMFRNVGLRRVSRRDCLVCGEEGVLNEVGEGGQKITRERIEKGEMDYQAFCGRVEDVRVLEAERRVTAEEFGESMRLGREGGYDKGGVVAGPNGSAERRPLVVDVREEVEYELGAKVRDSINIPISRILRYGHGHGQADDQDESMQDLLGLRSPGEEAGEDDRPIYFLCQRGNDSQIAAQRFLASIDEGKTEGSRRNRWIGDVVGGFEALQQHQQHQQRATS